MYGNLILEKFKSNSDDEIINLKYLRLLSCGGEKYTNFFGNLHMFEINFTHNSMENVKGQGEVHNFLLEIKQGQIKKTCIISHESLNIVGEKGLINTIKRICKEITNERVNEYLGGDDV